MAFIWCILLTSNFVIIVILFPPPCVEVGYLIAPPGGKPIAPHSDWKRSKIILNHEELQQQVRKSCIKPLVTVVLKHIWKWKGCVYGIFFSYQSINNYWEM